MRSQLGVTARLSWVLAVGLSLLAACADPEASVATGKKKKKTTQNTAQQAPSTSGGQTDPDTTDDTDDVVPEKQALPGEDLGSGDGKDVVAIGDSYMRIPTQLQEPGTEGVDLSLNKASGRQFRSFAITGASKLPITIPPKQPVAVAFGTGIIPGQFDNARKEAPVRTLLIAGGGNDLPQGGGPCKGATSSAAISAECKSLVDGINKLIDDFMAKLGPLGVKDVIWVAYGPTDPAKGLEGAVAALREDRKAKCVPDNPALGVRCHYIDNVAANIPTRDGFHPTPEGYDAIGKNVWARMQQEGTRR
ncbi:MAG TPA: SGNH/GDSL hydrolase family protein [Labilithrix sp.]|nr:SGNH/GDSL hydrolase family protein [Labilithrix sp.]